MIGYEWQFGSGTIQTKEERLTSVEQLKLITGDALGSLPSAAYERLVGKIIWTCLVRRPLFDALRCAVHPDSVTDTRVRSLVADEIRAIGQLAPLSFTNLSTPLLYISFNSDASPCRGVEMWSLATSYELGLSYPRLCLQDAIFRVLNRSFVPQGKEYGVYQ